MTSNPPFTLLALLIITLSAITTTTCSPTPTCSVGFLSATLNSASDNRVSTYNFTLSIPQPPRHDICNRFYLSIKPSAIAYEIPIAGIDCNESVPGDGNKTVINARISGDSERLVYFAQVREVFLVAVAQAVGRFRLGPVERPWDVFGSCYIGVQ